MYMKIMLPQHACEISIKSGCDLLLHIENMVKIGFKTVKRPDRPIVANKFKCRGWSIYYFPNII